MVHFYIIKIKIKDQINQNQKNQINQRSVYKSAFSANAQSRFASVVFDGVLGPPRLAQHT